MKAELLTRGITPCTLNWPEHIRRWWYEHVGSLNPKTREKQLKRDELTYTLETPEHPGRAHGMGVVPWKVGFAAHTNTAEATRGRRMKRQTGSIEEVVLQSQQREKKLEERVQQISRQVGLEGGQRDLVLELTIDVSPTQRRSSVASTEVLEQDDDVL
uniref:Uncharacterized protein n=1 Tax=Leersia perrieri TaxID=77586 RepID=A0A0D9XRG4_9ORYZ